MLTYDEALARILEAVPGPLPFEKVPLDLALGRAVAEDIFADSDLPPFDNSAVDGYAINGVSEIRQYYSISSEDIPAGVVPAPMVIGFASPIFTGAMVPEGADRVIMQEDAQPWDSFSVTFTSTGKPGQYIRRRGSDVAKDSLVLQTGHTLGAGEIGLLAALNRAEVPCVQVPTVGILTTGDELVPVGDGSLPPAKIRDANGPALVAAVTAAGGSVAVRVHSKDTKEAVHGALDGMAGCDVIIASGGVSVGDYDVVRSVLEERGTLDFWRIAIKPGKPLAFGKIGNALFFGLPGNPVSSLVTFELFVRPLLRKLAGFRQVTRPQASAVLTTRLPHEPGRREFVRATLEWKKDMYHATPTGAQGSHRIASLLGADCLLIAHEDHGDYESGAPLPLLRLDG